MNTPEGCGGAISPNSLQHQRNQNFAVEMAMAHIMRGGPAPMPVSWFSLSIKQKNCIIPLCSLFNFRARQLLNKKLLFIMQFMYK